MFINRWMVNGAHRNLNRSWTGLAGPTKTFPHSPLQFAPRICRLRLPPPPDLVFSGADLVFRGRDHVFAMDRSLRKVVVSSMEHVDVAMEECDPQKVQLHVSERTPLVDAVDINARMRAGIRGDNAFQVFNPETVARKVEAEDAMPAGIMLMNQRITEAETQILGTQELLVSLQWKLAQGPDAVYLGPSINRHAVDREQVVFPVKQSTYSAQVSVYSGVHEYRWDVPIHVDAASGGFISDFLYPELEWDFRLPLHRGHQEGKKKCVHTVSALFHSVYSAQTVFNNVLHTHMLCLVTSVLIKSINVNGHKYGLVYADVGLIIAQYYQLVCLSSFEENAAVLREGVTATGRFDILSKETSVPLVAFSHKDSSGFSVFDISENLRRLGWIVAVLRVVIRGDLSRSLSERLGGDVQKILHKLDARATHAAKGLQRHRTAAQSDDGVVAKKSVLEIEREVAAHWWSVVSVQIACTSYEYRVAMCSDLAQLMRLEKWFMHQVLGPVTFVTRASQANGSQNHKDMALEMCRFWSHL
ncbi:hypothetical protein U9M48_022217 [Paspalum notatum var. saurae]|uniref:Uncharacterized protein n=1 Tax=Paspalum notatum var. saurae TaxID=547442 RepID=A0AAQ3WUJ1_PASNO